MARLGRDSFARSAPEVARELIGSRLTSVVRGARVVVRLVETEAYTSDDPASHSFRGRTRRNSTMFERPGSLYVYLIYGMHRCLNVVTGQVGEGSAVLLRAAKPVEGLAEMAERRGTTDPRLLCSGPGRLAQALGLELSDDGTDLVTSDRVWLERGEAGEIEATPRVGVTKGAEVLWRFVEPGQWASRPSSRPSR